MAIEKQTKLMIFINKFFPSISDSFFNGDFEQLRSPTYFSLPQKNICTSDSTFLQLRKQGEECCFKPCQGRNVIRILVNLNRATTVTVEKRNGFCTGSFLSLLAQNKKI